MLVRTLTVSASYRCYHRLRWHCSCVILVELAAVCLQAPRLPLWISPPPKRDFLFSFWFGGKSFRRFEKPFPPSTKIFRNRPTTRYTTVASFIAGGTCRVH